MKINTEFLLIILPARTSIGSRDRRGKPVPVFLGASEHPPPLPESEAG